MDNEVSTGFSVEVVQLWKGQALDAELVSLDRPRRIAVGESGRFLLSIGESFDLVVVENGRAMVSVPARATATMFEGESTREIGNADGAIVIGASTTLEIALEGMTFIVRPVAKEHEKFAAPLLDATGGRWMAVAFAFHVAILAMFFFLPPDASALSSDLTGEQMRYIQVHLDAHELVPPPPAPTSGGDANSGASSAPEASSTDGAVSATPAVSGGPNRPARSPRTVMAPALTTETVSELGNFTLLARAFESSVGDPSPYESGNLTAGPFGPGNALVPGGLFGDTGPGGLHLSGAHGTCTHEPCAQGTIDQNGFDTHGGPGVHEGPPLTLHGPREIPATVRSACTESDPTCRTIGGLTREQIRSVISRHRPEVRFCYEQALIGRPGLEGRVTVGFQIAQDGHVSTSNASGIAGVDTCVAQAVQRWQFPTSPSPTAVSYPFILESTSAQ